jgi:hypothetical protein
VCCCSPWIPPSKSKFERPTIQRPTSTSATSVAIEPAQSRGHGTTQSTSAAASGRKISVVVSQPLI